MQRLASSSSTATVISSSGSNVTPSASIMLPINSILPDRTDRHEPSSALSSPDAGPDDATNYKSSNSKVGIIAGSVVGGSILLLLLAIASCVLRRRSKRALSRPIVAVYQDTMVHSNPNPPPASPELKDSQFNILTSADIAFIPALGKNDSMSLSPTPCSSLSSRSIPSTENGQQTTSLTQYPFLDLPNSVSKAEEATVPASPLTNTTSSMYTSYTENEHELALPPVANHPTRVPAELQKRV
ncbi:hypothetical protein VKT23_013083 [Stygiomarasmius scandens]|uniref:Uncharacterized protein n=1 Tax=Marasmiellus scandens TaxID=2682957 RepID=A0ABR1J4Y0_9AGAR